MVSIGPASVLEGNTGSTANMVFTVSLSAASGRQVTVQYQTANGTARPRLPTRTTTPPAARSPLLQARRPSMVTVQVRGDVLGEQDETFLVNLSNAVNANIGALRRGHDPRRRTPRVDQ